MRAALEPRRRRAGVGLGHPGPCRRADRRGRGHARGDEPGHGRGRHRQHGRPPPVGRRAGHGPRRRGDAARRQRGDRLRAGRRAVAQGQDDAGPGVRALRVVAERGGRGRSDTLEAPFVGRDDELRLLKDLFHATGARGPDAAGVRHRHRRHRQEPARVGVREVPRRDRRDGLVAPRPLAGLRRGDQLLGAGRDDPAAGPASPRPTTSGRPRARIAALLDELVPDRGRATLDRARAARAAGDRDRRSAASSCSAPGAPSSSGCADGRRWCSSSRTSTGPTRARSTSSTTCSSGAARSPLYIVTLARPELLERRPDWGAGRRNFTSLYLEPLAEPAMRGAARRASSQGCPRWRVRRDRRARGGDPALRRGDGADARRRGRARRHRRRDATRRPATSRRSAVPETLDRAHRRPPRRPRPGRPEPASSTQRSSARASRRRRSPPCRGSTRATLEPGCGRSSGASCSPIDTDPRSPERGQYAFVQALIREVAYNTLARKRPQERATLPRRATSRRSGRTSSPAALAGHYLAARDNAADGPEADALGAQARIALRGRRRTCSDARRARPGVGFSTSRPSTSRRDPADRAELLQRAGEAASAAGRHEAAERHLRAAVEQRREPWRARCDRRRPGGARPGPHRRYQGRATPSPCWRRRARSSPISLATRRHRVGRPAGPRLPGCR